MKVGDAIVIVDDENKVHESSKVTAVKGSTIHAKDETGKIYISLKHVSETKSAPYWRLSSENPGPNEKNDS